MQKARTMPQKQAKIRLADVAKQAGTGIATVDRVLNQRGGVSPKTEQRVLQAAKTLGLRRILPPPYMRTLRIEVLLGPGFTFFMQRLNHEIAQISASLDRSITVLRSTMDQDDPDYIAARIARSRADGIILYCSESQQNIASITKSEATGRPVICIVTDVPTASRSAYVGINHNQAGRTAGLFIGRMSCQRPGKVLLLATSTSFRAHMQRIDGFKTALATYAPNLLVMPVLTTQDKDDACYHHVVRSLRRNAEDISAIYNTGGGNFGIGQALKDFSAESFSADSRIIFIGHELTPESRILLQDKVMSLVIDQAPELQARQAIKLMLKKLTGQTLAPIEGEIAFTLHTSENC